MKRRREKSNPFRNKVIIAPVKHANVLVADKVSAALGERKLLLYVLAGSEEWIQLRRMRHFSPEIIDFVKDIPGCCRSNCAQR